MQLNLTYQITDAQQATLADMLQIANDADAPATINTYMKTAVACAVAMTLMNAANAAVPTQDALLESLLGSESSG